MVVRSNRILRHVCVGDNVLVPIPSVDRGRGDPRNLLCCIIAVDGETFKQSHVNAAIQGATTACLAVTNKASDRDEHYLNCHQCIIHSSIVDKFKGFLYFAD